MPFEVLRGYGNLPWIRFYMYYAMMHYIKRVDALTKREALDSVFCKKLKFDINEYPTLRVNEAALLSITFTKKYVEIKKERS
jgi:hypothetical protein